MIKVSDIEIFLKESGIAHQIRGNTDVSVDSFKPLNSIENNKLTWVKKWEEKSEEKIYGLHSLIVVCKSLPDKINEQNCYIVCDDPKMCFFEVLGRFYLKKNDINGISENAVVETEKIGLGTSIGAFSYIGKNVEIGQNVTIGTHVTIIGDVKIGNETIIKHGAVLGESGYGYYVATDGHRKKVPHLGGIVIGNHVEIGSNTCIDRGTMGDTVIEDYTKIDNLCHISHNVQIGKDVMIVAGTVICGSCVIADGSYIAPGAVLKNQIKLGRDSFVGIQTAVVRDVDEVESVFGVPGRPIKRDYMV